MCDTTADKKTARTLLRITRSVSQKMYVIFKDVGAASWVDLRWWVEITNDNSDADGSIPGGEFEHYGIRLHVSFLSDICNSLKRAMAERCSFQEAGQVFYKLRIDKIHEIRVTGKLLRGCQLIHIREWYCSPGGIWYPTKSGVALYPSEMEQLIHVLSELLDELPPGITSMGDDRVHEASSDRQNVVEEGR